MNLDGFLLVDKSSGPTSHDIVDLFRRRSRIKKVGHTGTLDPLATGLLVLCVGRSTRLQSYLMKLEKDYEGTIQFGVATDTYDSAGRELGERKSIDLSQVDLEPHVATFRGEIDQIPPAYSAKKIDGVRAYELARKGEEVKIDPKRVTVYELEVTPVSAAGASFRMRCSAGTYVRSVAHDLGQLLGCGAHLKSLRRTKVGEFDIKDAIPSDRIREAEDDELFGEPHFRGMDKISLPLPDVMLDPSQEKRLASGQSVIVKPADGTILTSGALLALTNTRDELIGIGEVGEVLRDGGPTVILPKVVLRA